MIVPHLNDPGLEDCLKSLTVDQDFDGEWEVLVVDNGSVAPPKALCARYERVRLLHEPTPGPGPARNKGISEANGRILAFTDADCAVSSNWLAVIDHFLTHNKARVIGGQISVPFKDPHNPSMIETYERVYSFRNKAHIAEGYSAAANLATLPTIFENVGGFGGRDIAEDQEWGLRASALGFTPSYVREMQVSTPARKNWEALQDKWGRHIAHHFNANGGGAKWNLRALAVLVSPLLEIPHIWRTDLLEGPRQRLLCFAGLCRIRSFRAFRMLSPNRTRIRWNER